MSDERIPGEALREALRDLYGDDELGAGDMVADALVELLTMPHEQHQVAKRGVARALDLARNEPTSAHELRTLRRARDLVHALHDLVLVATDLDALCAAGEA